MIAGNTKNNHLIINHTIKKGIAKNWTLTLTKQCLDWHKKEYGNVRPELFSDNFINKDIISVVENPENIYPNVRIKKGKLKLNRKSVVVFYKKFNNPSWESLNGEPVNYIRVVTNRIKKNKKLEIITAFITQKNNHKNLSNKFKKICKPLTKL